MSDFLNYIQNRLTNIGQATQTDLYDQWKQDIESQGINLDDVSIFNNINSGYMPNNDLSEQYIDNFLRDNTTAPEDRSFLEILRSLFSIDGLRNEIDQNTDGVLDNSEVQNFLLSATILDGINIDPTLDEATDALDGLGIDVVNTPETGNTPTTTLPEEAVDAPAPSSKPGRTGGSGGGGGGGNDYNPAPAGSNDAPAPTGPAADTIEGLQAQKTELEQNKQTELQKMSEISSGSTPELTALQTDMKQAQQELDEAMANETPEVKALKELLDESNKNLTLQTSKLDENNIQITETTSDINQTQGTLDSLDAAKKSLGEPTGKEGDEDRDAAIIARKKQIDREIGETEDKLRALNATLEKLNEAKADIEEQIRDLNSSITDFEAQIAAKGNEATQAAIEHVQNAKTAFETQKAAQLTTVQSSINDITNQINDITNKINQKENEKAQNTNNTQGIYESMGLDQKGLNFQVFSDALEGYSNLKDKGNGMLGIFDTTQGAGKERYYLLDMNTGKLVEQSIMKTGSGNMGNIKTANQSGSHATLSGFEIVAEEYYSSGMGKRALRLDGLEPGINDNSRDKGTVFHWTKYNNTWGCKGFPPVYTNGRVDEAATYARMRELAPTGTIIYTHPTDSRYKEMSALV